jgi:hypothetical protein
MPNPWIILGAVAFAIAAYFYGHYEGGHAVTAQWEAEKSQANAQAAQVLQEANARVLEAERALAVRQVKVEKVYVEKIKEVEVERNSLSATARNDGLFIDAACPDSGGELSGAATGPGGDHGGTKARLSGEAADALIALAADADEVVHQLQACQAILIEERKP